MIKTLLNFIFLVILINNTHGQGNSCANPIDLNPLVPVTGNGKINIPVDNSMSGQFYTYTATQVGIIEMSSAFSNAPGDPTFDTWLRVYDNNCNLIFDEDNTPGLLGGVEFRTNVEIGDTYVFEWANHEWAGTFNVEFIYHVPVPSITCDDPSTLSMGLNHADNWFGPKFYTFTAPNNGTLTISTCDHSSAVFRNTFILNDCNGSNIASIDYSCDIDDDDLHTATYNMTNGESVIVKMEGYIHMHHDYDFTASFETTLSVQDEFRNSFNAYPNPVEDEIFVQMNTLNTVENIALYDFSGRQLSINWTMDVNNLIKVNIQNMSTGVYIIKINNTVKKIIKK
jgi:hypothetical protein